MELGLSGWGLITGGFDPGKSETTFFPATRTSRQRIAIRAFETASDEMIAQIQWMLTARQKAHLNKQLSRYIDELRKLGAGIKATGSESGIDPAAQSRPGANR